MPNTPGNANAARQPNVLVLNWRDPANPRAGGAEIHMWEVFKRAAVKGWNITVLCCSFPGSKREEMVDGIRVIRRGGEFSFYGLWPVTFRRLIREIQPDLIFEFMNKLPFFSPLITRGTVMCYVHHLFGDAAHHEFPRLLAWLVKTSESLVPWVYSRNTFLAGADSTVAELVRLGLPKQNVRVVPYGIDVDGYKPGIKSDTPKIIFVGRLKKYKGLHDLIAVVAKLRQQFPNLELDIVGHGDAREALEAHALTLGVEDAVIFHGYVDQSRKVQLYQQAWIASLPSAKEGFGLTIPEAALCDVPTVGYDVSGVQDAIRNGETGLLAPWGDVDALAVACASLLGDASMRETFGAAARALYATFTWDRAAESIQELISSQLVDSKMSLGTLAQKAGRFDHHLAPAPVDERPKNEAV